ncbi:cytochrome c oxidase assembly protein [Citreimonas salinaria]|uniref:Putative membrane protein n=1 Tax=Citreimonas salinaria TaxID=321339 RepID=A0A1H3NVR8_9RHOB|nr:cytochrome c oxidase assembly protein [Citreimonas salinaria]SDY92800.1 putative membrane protein [Citreimonas salinaria]
MNFRFLLPLPGLGLLALIWLFPLERMVPVFAAHMLRHMTLVALAAPLVVVGLPSATAALRVSPLFGTMAELVVVWSWHLPAAHEFGRLTSIGFVAEQTSFLVVGLLVWTGCLRSDRPLAGAAGLLVTSMHMTLLGALLILAPRDLYGTSPDLAGQRIGGMLMLGIGTPVYLIAGLAFVSLVLRERASA